VVALADVVTAWHLRARQLAGRGDSSTGTRKGCFEHEYQTLSPAHPCPGGHSYVEPRDGRYVRRWTGYTSGARTSISAKRTSRYVFVSPGQGPDDAPRTRIKVNPPLQHPFDAPRHLRPLTGVDYLTLGEGHERRQARTVRRYPRRRHRLGALCTSASPAASTFLTQFVLPWASRIASTDPLR
jgi:hypothetical protein